jgi:putative transposase
MPALNGNVTKKRGKSKMPMELKRQQAAAKLAELDATDPDVRTELIQALIPLGLKAVGDQLNEEFARLTGARHDRSGENYRWGHQNGSVYLRDQKFPIKVPRVRSAASKREVPLESYQRFKQPFLDSGDQAFRKLLHGLSTHRYAQSSSLAAEAFGLSATSLSKRFKADSESALRNLQTRSLKTHDFVAVFIDGKRYADDGVMVGLGVTLEGRKVILGIVQIHTENSKAIEEWLDQLIHRGLKYDEGLLFVIDGAKGIKKALERKFGLCAVIQRCRWHKGENVAAYLDESQKALVRIRMKNAYAKTTYDEAKNELLKLHTELARVNESAATSLLEGLEETLTLHKLGLSPELSKHLGTTNQIESVMSQIGQFTDKVDRWHNSNQILRWTAASLVDLEPRLWHIRGFRYLPMLKSKIKEVVLKRRSESVKQRELVEVS